MRRKPSPWPKHSSEEVGRFHVFRLLRLATENPRNGLPQERMLLEAPDWMNVIAVTKDREIVMVRQFRFGCEDITLELPGGIVEEGEPLEAAARRELLEETGYEAGHWEYLGFSRPNPALLSNRCHTFLATGALEVKELELDPGEDISVELVHAAAIRERIHSGDIDHALVISAFYLFETRGAPALDVEAVELPVDGVLDLHTFSAREAGDLVADYLEACAARGIGEVRVVHGKGKGELRRQVHAVLKRHPLVRSFELAGPESGGWGATRVWLNPGPPKSSAAGE